MERPPSTLTALNDKELEVLRLLAAGHTAKSIAASLNRSEASINERLRDARRKTGVGSSRELARLLDAQKIWDKNIDLHQPDPSTDEVAQPPATGRTWSKGTMIVLAAMSIAAAGVTLTASDPKSRAKEPVSALATPARQAPLVGTWSLDVARIPAKERPQQVTIGFDVAPDRKWTINVEIVAPDGSVQRSQSTAAPDGIPVPISGNMEFIDTASLRQPAPNTLVLTLARQGAPVSTRVYSIGKDQKTMTETIIWAGQAVPKLETTYFTRTG